MSIAKTKYQIKYAKNRESNLRNTRKHYKKYRKRILAYQARYRAAHKEEIAERDRRYRQSHKENQYLRVRARAARVKGKVIKEEISNWGKGTCGICDTSLDGKFEMDHIIPLSKGGLHIGANIQLAHRYCNRSKKDRLDFKINKTALPDGLFVS